MDAVTGVVLSVVILGIIAIVITEKYFHYKERIDVQKIQKVKDVNELNYVFPQDDKEPEEEEDTRVSLEDLKIEDIQ